MVPESRGFRPSRNYQELIVIVDQSKWRLAKRFLDGCCINTTIIGLDTTIWEAKKNPPAFRLAGW
jgi:hypothetical protein